MCVEINVRWQNSYELNKEDMEEKVIIPPQKEKEQEEKSRKEQIVQENWEDFMAKCFKTEREMASQWLRKLVRKSRRFLDTCSLSIGEFHYV